MAQTYYGWGLGTAGQFAQITAKTNQSVAIQMPSYSWGSEANFYNNFCGITTSGDLIVWGYGGYGQFSQNNISNTSSPVFVLPLGVWQSAFMNNTNFIGLRKDGTLWVCGSGGAGALGNNSLVSVSSIIQVGSQSDWTKAITTGSNPSMYAWRGTALYVWGENTVGQLGLGTVVNVSSPILLDNSGTWQQIMPGNGCAMGIKTDGTLWATGRSVIQWQGL